MANDQKPATILGGVLQVSDKLLERLATDVAKRWDDAQAGAEWVRADEARYDAQATKNDGTVVRFGNLAALPAGGAPANAGGLLTSLRPQAPQPEQPAAQPAAAPAATGTPTPQSNPGGR